MSAPLDDRGVRLILREQFEHEASGTESRRRAVRLRENVVHARCEGKTDQIKQNVVSPGANHETLPWIV